MGPLRLSAAKQMVSAALLAPENFPFLPAELKGKRKLYVRGVSEQTRLCLEEKGYVVTDLITLPRITVEDQVNYMLARAQGIEEGTLFATDSEQKALWLQMRAFGLLDRREVTLNVFGGKEQEVKKDGLEAVLAWGQSKHSLSNNTTVQGLTSHKPTGRQANARDPKDSLEHSPRTTPSRVFDAEEELQ